jgi:mono/diheme cytochrome c family protein
MKYRIALACAAIAFSSSVAAPSLAQAPAVPMSGFEDGDDADAGMVIFRVGANRIGCQACHGLGGAGKLGPDIRGKDSVAIAQAMGNVPEMANVRLTEVEIAQVSAYLLELHEAAAH